MRNEHALRIKSAISRGATLGIVILVIVIIVIGGYLAISTRVPTTSTSTTSSSSSLTTLTSSIGPKNSDELIDESPTAAYDSLDPGVGFFVDPYFANVFQGLVQFDPTNLSNVVPALASSWTVSSNLENYTFTMRPNTWFSNKDPINAYVAWFSFVRELYMNNPDGVGISNYAQLTVNTSDPLDSTLMGNIFPHGLQNALASAGLCTVSTTNDNSCVAALNYMMSNFNPSNKTQLAVMSYPHQAYVAVSSSTFQINLIQPYRLFLLDLPPQWGAIVDPTFIDLTTSCSPLCVQNNTSPSYFTTNGMVGSGPYVYGTHSVGNTLLTLTKNPNYWALGVSGLSSALRPASIPNIEIQFGDEPSTEIEDFAFNDAQIISPPIAQFAQAWSAFHSNEPQFSFSQIYYNSGYPLCDLANEINTQVYPTNITLLRQAIVHSVNYSEIQQALFTYNGTVLGRLFLPPVPPGWGPLDNPENIPLYSYNITLAQQLIAEAGQQNDFYVTLPNGTMLGDTSGSALPSIEFAYILPSTAETQTLLGILQNDLSNIGITIAATGLTESVIEADMSSASTTPQIVGGIMSIGWCADFPDPIYQQFYDMGTTITHVPNWVNNATLTTLLEEIPFETNSTLQLQQTEEAYNIFTQLATIIQMPQSTLEQEWHQPYLTGLTYLPFEWAFLYNMISYS